LARSAKDSERDAEGKRVADVFQKAGATAEYTESYSAWPPDPDSPLLKLMEQVYLDTFSKEAEVTAIHAGLEASSAKSTYPGMDIVSVGPTLENVHSPDERLKVDTVPKAYDLIVATLEQVE
jgi:dipeptidase D